MGGLRGWEGVLGVLLGGGGGELEEGTETGGQKEAVERGGERAEGSRREAAEGDTRGK